MYVPVLSVTASWWYFVNKHLLLNQQNTFMISIHGLCLIGGLLLRLSGTQIVKTDQMDWQTGRHSSNNSCFTLSNLKTIPSQSKMKPKQQQQRLRRLYQLSFRFFFFFFLMFLLCCHLVIMIVAVVVLSIEQRRNDGMWRRDREKFKSKLQ